MAKRYEVLERSFINGRLYEAGEFVVLEIDSPGSNLKLITATEGLGKAPASQGSGFAAARTGGGKFLVKDDQGRVVGDFTGSKAEAEAEAARLNAGGELNPPPASDAPPPGDGDQDDDNGPDA